MTLITFSNPDVAESLDMDQDLKKALKDMAEAVKTLAESQKGTEPTVAPIKQSGFTWNQIWVAIPTAVVLLTGCWGVLQYTISSEITKAFVEPNKALQNMSKDVEYLRKDVNSLQTQSSIESLKHSASNPEDKESAIDASKTIDSARENSIQLPAALIEKVGQRFVEASKSNPAAWEAAIKLVEYKSFLNTSASLPVSGPILEGPDQIDVTYFAPVGLNMKNSMYTSTASSPPNIPELHEIGRPDKNLALKMGPKYLIFNGGTFKADGFVFKHLILENMHISYNGGPLVLQDVIFINCTFEMPLNKRSQSLTIAGLSVSPSTTFSGG
jgi:hypothetical protein